VQRWITLSVSRARQGEFGSPRYLLFFDVRNPDSRHAAAEVRGLLLPLSDLVRRKLPVSLENIEVCPVSATPPIEGQLCLRRGEHPDIPDVSDLPLDEPPTSSVPLEEIDGYHLTPIEVPFYKELRETGLVFAVQPRIQGVDRPYRLDFLVLVGGAAVAVELDGHEYHKTKEQRRRDAERDRWFEARGIRTLRWTGSEVYADPRGCVAELVAILRASRTPK
jgi:very-short-patch-repair endonuclease